MRLHAISKMADEDDPVTHEVDVYLSKSLAENLYLLQIQLELPLNTHTPNYAYSKGEQMALIVDGQYKPSEQNFFNSNVMDKTVLASGPCTASTQRYAVGVYKDESSQEEEEEEAKPVRLKFARHETVEAKARRMASYDYLQKKREEEQWINVKHHSIDDDKSVSERNLLFAAKNHEVTEFNIPTWEYLEKLMPPVTEEHKEKPALPNNILSLSQLRTMPLQEQVKALLINAKVIQFRQLLALLPRGTDPTAVIRCLQQVAILVQGCWVVKSEILYPKGTTSPHSGVSAEHLCRGRDYLMWRFLHSSHVTRKEISFVIKLPAEDVKDILEQMSRVRASHGWEFLFEYDKEFCSRYPEIVQRQKVLWEARFQTLCKQLKINPKEVEKKCKEQASPEKSKKPRTPTKSRKRTLSGRSISDHSDVEVDNPDKVINIKEESDDGGCEIVEVNNETSLTNGPASKEASGALYNNHAHTNSGGDMQQELQSFVRDKLYSRYVLTLSELKRLFHLKLTQCQSGHILGTGVSDKMLEQAVIDVGGIKINNQWPPASSVDEPVFTVIKNGDYLDPDYCITKGCLWYLKGTYTEES
ncbi:RPC5 [Acanthosepion pharaonis]|uniref:RPC5 n=1 Tax=Acanthosepion pharaonis TaxID=158019 RepID=A0A812DCG5_ACAPH|nr:RPC5 [Sepia pharaonis]